jgi:hypothetical protein
MFVAAAGSAIADRACSTCPPGAFSTSSNLQACTPWTNCGPAELESSPGTTTTDRTCQSCVSTVQFGASTSYLPTPSYNLFAVGDLNRDGKPDLVATPTASDRYLRVALGVGDGSFISQTAVTLSHFPNELKLFDFDRDGVLDVVLACDDGFVSFKRGLGTGAFAPSVDLALSIAPTSMDVGDVNRDGILDLVVGDPGPDLLGILLGNGDGTFFSSSTVPSGGSTQSVALADVDRDGALDVVTSNSNGDLGLVVGRGDGTFAAPRLFTSVGANRRLALGDLNGDTRVDVVALPSGTGKFVALMGDGAGGFTPLTAQDAGSSPISVRLSDLDRDGILDLIVASQFGLGLYVLTGHGDGGFASPMLVRAGKPNVGEGFDVNNDGWPDLLASDAAFGRIFVALNTTPRLCPWKFGTPTEVVDAGTTSSVTLEDLDRDGRLDLISTQPSLGRAAVHFAAAGGTFSSAGSFSGATPREAASGDFNRDGKPDFGLVNAGTSTVSIFLGNGDQTFAAPADHVLGPTSAPAGLTSVDLNRDGRLDLLAADPGTNTLLFLQGDGAGGFDPPTTFSIGTGAGPSALAVGDLNRDGRLDVLTANSATGDVTVLLGSSTGVLGAPSIVAAGAGTAGIAVGDLNLDGILDLATTSSVTNSVRVRLGDGAGGLLTESTLAVGLSPGPVAVIDANGDGKPDLITVDRVGGTTSVLYGLGDGSFLPAVSTMTTAPPLSGLAFGDLNRDGKPDLAVGSNHGVELLLGGYH